MTKEEKRIKLAELCGYQRGVRSLGDMTFTFWLIPGHDRLSPHNWLTERRLPDYCNDLNAVAEVRNALTKEQRNKYVHALENTVMAKAPDQGWTFATVNASAEDHTTALILTLSQA